MDNNVPATPFPAPQRQALRMEKATAVYRSVLENGKRALLNSGGTPATVKLATGKTLMGSPYGPWIE